MWDVFEQLEGMVQTTRSSIGRVIVHGDARDFECEGTSVLQSNWEIGPVLTTWSKLLVTRGARGKA